MLAPGSALRVVVEKQRLKAIQRMSEAGFRRGVRFKLVPEGAKLSGLIRRQLAATFVFVCSAVIRARMYAFLVDH